MSMPPRQPRPMPAGGAPHPGVPDPDEPVLSLEDLAQQALDASRKIVPYLPVVGPAYETYEDLREGNYAGAAFNGAMLAADLSPIAPLAKAAEVVRAINATRRGPLLARAFTQAKRMRKIESAAREAKGIEGAYEIHHTIPMKRWGPIAKADRNEEGLLRNHPALLKVLDKETHHRLTRSFTREDGTVLPRFDPLRRVWHGTNALEKAAAASAAGTFADWSENLSRPFGAPGDPQRKR